MCVCRVFVMTGRVWCVDVSGRRVCVCAEVFGRRGVCGEVFARGECVPKEDVYVEDADVRHD